MQRTGAIQRERDERALQIGCARASNSFDHPLVHRTDHLSVAGCCRQKRAGPKPHGVSAVVWREPLLAHDLDDHAPGVACVFAALPLRDELSAPRLASTPCGYRRFCRDLAERGCQRRRKTGVRAELCRRHRPPPPRRTSAAGRPVAFAPDMAVRSQTLQVSAHRVLVETRGFDELRSRRLRVCLDLAKQPLSGR